MSLFYTLFTERWAYNVRLFKSANRLNNTINSAPFYLILYATILYFFLYEPPVLGFATVVTIHILARLLNFKTSVRIVGEERCEEFYFALLNMTRSFFDVYSLLVVFDILKF